MTQLDRPIPKTRPLAPLTLALLGALLACGLAWGAAARQMG